MKAEALNLDSLFESLYELRRRRDERAGEVVMKVDPVKLLAAGIPFGWSGETVLLSSDGARRAREVGAIVPA